jgi:hypothetical protein
MKSTIIALAALSAISVRAEFFTGNELLAHINSNDSGERSIALGYLLGVHDAGRGVYHCTPATVNGRQVRDLARDFLQENAASRHNSADILVSAILSRTFPCPKTSSGGGSRL